MPALEIRLFRNATVRVDGQALTPAPAQKVLWLLAYLVLHQDRETSCETLAAILWPDTDDDMARFYLRRSLSQLRRALGPFGNRLLSPTPRTLRLDLSGDEVFCDVLAFDRATTPAERLALYAGPLLLGCYDDGILAERERYAALAQEARESLESAVSWLPCPLTELLGREREQAELSDLLRRCRLITLFGPGGSGKTRLSLAVAEAARDAFIDGAWFVDLSPLSSGADVAFTVLTTLNCTEKPNQTPQEALLEALAKKSLLLVLDNAEHILKETAALTLVLLTKCPKLKILTTSRQVLGLVGEQLYPVSPLALPPPEAFRADTPPKRREKDPHTLLDFAALQLFVERAMQANPAFRLTWNNAEAVVEICRRLDGMPLAIEMAATRVRYQSVQEIVGQLSECLETLSVGTPVVPARQRSLQAAIEWSYNLLEEEEKAAFRAVSVFQGGWSASMAEAISPGTSARLASLVDKSLVVCQAGGGDGGARYSLLQTLQQFAAARARAQGEEGRLKARHLMYLSQLSEESRENLVGPKLLEELDRLEREHDNLRAALRFGCESTDAALQYQALVLAGNLHRFWYTRSYFSEATQWYERLLALPGCQETTGAQGLCQLGLGLFTQMRGDHQVALTSFQACLERQAAIGNHLNQAYALNHISGLYSGWGDTVRNIAYARRALYHAYLSGNLNTKAHLSINLGIAYITADHKRKGRLYLDRGLAAAQRQGNRHLIGVATGALAEVLWSQGETEKACELGRSNVARCRQVGRNHALAIALNYLGLFLTTAKQFDEARRYHTESLLLAQELGIYAHCTATLEYIAEFESVTGHFEKAVTIHAALMGLRKLPQGEDSTKASALPALRAALQDEAFESAFARGAAMTLEDVIALAVEP